VILNDSSTSAADLNNRGFAKMQNGDIKSAIDDFLEAVKRNPDEAGYLENPAWAQAGTRRFADAAKTLDQAIAITPHDPETYWKRGRTRMIRPVHWLIWTGSFRSTSFDEGITTSGAR